MPSATVTNRRTPTAASAAKYRPRDSRRSRTTLLVPTASAPLGNCNASGIVRECCQHGKRTLSTDRISRSWWPDRERPSISSSGRRNRSRDSRALRWCRLGICLRIHFARRHRRLGTGIRVGYLSSGGGDRTCACRSNRRESLSNYASAHKATKASRGSS